jgi:hypothetical protein
MEAPDRIAFSPAAREPNRSSDSEVGIRRVFRRALRNRRDGRWLIAPADDDSGDRLHTSSDIGLVVDFMSPRHGCRISFAFVIGERGRMPQMHRSNCAVGYGRIQSGVVDRPFGVKLSEDPPDYSGLQMCRDASSIVHLQHGRKQGHLPNFSGGIHAAVRSLWRTVAVLASVATRAGTAG